MIILVMSWLAEFGAVNIEDMFDLIKRRTVEMIQGKSYGGMKE